MDIEGTFNLNPSEIDVPDSLASKWQSITDILARVSGFPAALIMHVEAPEIEVFVSSQTEGNPYKKGERASLETGLYCETVMATRTPLYVRDALKDPAWDHNPDIELGMVCYFGIPVLWPDGTPFGTICILDRQGRERPPETEKLMQLLREVVEHDLKMLVVSAQEKGLQKIELQEEQERYAAVFQQAAVGIARVGTDGSWLEVNDKLCKITGYSHKELMARTFQDITYPDDLDVDLGYVEQMLNGEIANYSMEKRYIHKQGHVVWVLLTVSLVRDSQGEPKYFISVVEDISEKKTLQREVEQAQKLEIMGTLVGGIAHDFNNKLAAVTANLFLASRTQQDYKKFLHEAEKMCFQASDMIKGLLTYARKEHVDKNTLALNSFLKEVLKSFRVVFPENIKLSSDIGSEQMLVDGNTTQIQQVLLNLINNAKDAVDGVDEPEVRISLNSVIPDDAFKKRHLNVQAERFARLEVADNGTGMTEAVKEKIFEPFFTTKPAGKGTGLGLAMVYSLVQQHDGIVEVESSQETGTTFHIYFPILDNATAEQETEAQSRIIEGGGRRIMVVDDDEGVLNSTSDVLEYLGYEVVKANDGEDALNKYMADGNISCVLSDVVMPSMGGVELLNRLKQHDSEAKMIFMTGYDSGDELKSMDCPVLLKPIAVGNLCRELYHLIGSEK